MLRAAELGPGMLEFLNCAAADESGLIERSRDRAV